MEPTSQDILEAIQTFAGDIDKRFDLVDKRFDLVDQRFVDIEHHLGSSEKDIGTIKSDIGSMKSDIISIKSRMVTKDYLDDKIADLRGDLVLLARKGNTKLSILVEDLVAQKSLDPVIARKILALEPFPSV